MFITLQPIKLAKVAQREHFAHWITYAKIVLLAHGQKMPHLDAAPTDNTKDSTRSAKTVHQERTLPGVSADPVRKINVDFVERERLEKTNRNLATVYF